MKHGGGHAATLTWLLLTGTPSLAVGRGTTLPPSPLAFASPSPLGHHRAAPRARQRTRGWVAVAAAGGGGGAKACVSRRLPWQRQRGCASAWFLAGSSGAACSAVGREVGGSRSSSSSSRHMCVPADAAVSIDVDAAREGGGEEEEEEERYIRRLDVAVRRVWSAYYTCSDTRDTAEPLQAFLREATGALDAGMSPGDLAARLKSQLLDSSERIDFHLDGDQPMVLYRLWLRGRAIDVYERDLFHSPRWIELVAETKNQMDAEEPGVAGGDGMGTICYPNGDIFEGKVDSLVRRAQEEQEGGFTPSSASASASASASSDALEEAEVVSADDTSGSSGRYTKPRGLAGHHHDGSGDNELGVPPADVTTVSGVVSLTIGCMKDGMSDEAAILQRHLKSPDFGHPLLRLASPTSTEVSFPHMPDEDERDPAHERAEAELTEEHREMGERGAKEMMHDRRRSQLDVYLVCAAYRANRRDVAAAAAAAAAAAGVWGAEAPTLQLGEEDARHLDELLRQAALI